MDTIQTSSQGVVISAAGWIITGVVAWLAVAAVIAVLIAGMIRKRDRQVPTDVSGSTADGRLPRIPEQSGQFRVPGAVARSRRQRD